MNSETDLFALPPVQQCLHWVVRHERSPSKRRHATQRRSSRLSLTTATSEIAARGRSHGLSMWYAPVP